uniref:Helicase-associated domain-containing protein n=1 Tax=Proboscia inermis TaxID=420281 RepID=A0A7S0BXB4_9STRA|mmetsp:Transcript_14646/g.14845  ORF Transcript_14646/g.14845 Transcript_14646/m.14845 type:complete len:492 (+) Transcript_14646:14-1489(+)
MNATIGNTSENEEQYGALKNLVDSYLSDFESQEELHIAHQSSERVGSSNICCVESQIITPKRGAQNIVTESEDGELRNFDIQHQAKLQHNKKSNQRSGIPLSTFLRDGYFSDQMDLNFREQSLSCMGAVPRIVSDDENTGDFKFSEQSSSHIGTDPRIVLDDENTGLQSKDNSKCVGNWGESFADIWECFEDHKDFNTPAQFQSIRKDEDIELCTSDNKIPCLPDQSAAYSDKITGIISDDDNPKESDKRESCERTTEVSDNWYEMASDLLEYCSDHEHHKKTSHCYSKKKTLERHSIQRHDCKQKQNDETTSMTSTRIKTTESLDPKTTMPTAGRSTWRDMFTKLQEYKNNYGDCLVPQKFLDDPKLGRWVDKQRHWYKCKKEGRKASLNLNQIEEMNSIGFVWSVNKQHNWEEMFDLLGEYRALHGNCLVSATCEKYSKLGRWVAQQRHHYKRLTSGYSSPMSTDTGRIKRLEGVGFAWHLTRGKETKF